MSRHNHRRGVPQASRFQPTTKGAPRRKGSPIPLDQMVIPVGRCGRKLTFATEAAAKRALFQAQVTRKANRQIYSEKRSYLCDRCGFFHLTSRDK